MGGSCRVGLGFILLGPVLTLFFHSWSIQILFLGMCENASKEAKLICVIPLHSLLRGGELLSFLIYIGHLTNAG